MSSLKRWSFIPALQSCLDVLFRIIKQFGSLSLTIFSSSYFWLICFTALFEFIEITVRKFEIFKRSHTDMLSRKRHLFLTWSLSYSLLCMQRLVLNYFCYFENSDLFDYGNSLTNSESKALEMSAKNFTNG